MSLEAEREKFRAYIEKSGLMSALTNTLVTLYEEPNKPSNALNFVMESLGSKSPDAKQVEMLEKKVQELEKENQQLKTQLSQLTQSSLSKEDAASQAAVSDSPKEES